MKMNYLKTELFKSQHQLIPEQEATLLERNVLVQIVLAEAEAAADMEKATANDESAI